MDYCTNCGAPLKPGARFCGSCSASAGDPDETRLASEETRFASEETRLASPRPRAVQPPPAPSQHAPQTPARPQPVQPLARPAERRFERDEVEQNIFTARPTLLFVKLGYALAALGGILLIALFALLSDRVNVPLYVTIPLALALLLIPAYRHFRRNMLRYTLTDSKIEIDQGFVSRTTRNIPLRNIQDVTVTATVFQRLLRIGNVVVDNAGAEGGTTVLRDIPDPRRHADLILREMRRWH